MPDDRIDPVGLERMILRNDDFEGELLPELVKADGSNDDPCDSENPSEQVEWGDSES